MHRAWPVLAVLLCGMARGQAPAYSAAGIVNASDFSAGPFAPNSVLSLFGSNLSNTPAAVSASETAGGALTNQLGNVSVLVANMPAPLLYVSNSQINFLIPTELIPGAVTVCVVRQGVSGPIVTIALVNGAPALFPSTDGYALAVDWNNGNALASAQASAQAGDTVIVYLTGLGAAGNTPTGQVPGNAFQINNLSSLKVYLNGVAVDPLYVKYAGVTPGWAGLYQINLYLTLGLGTDPEIRVAIGDQLSVAGLKLAVR